MLEVVVHDGRMPRAHPGACVRRERLRRIAGLRSAAARNRKPMVPCADAEHEEATEVGTRYVDDLEDVAPAG